MLKDQGFCNALFREKSLPSSKWPRVGDLIPYFNYIAEKKQNLECLKMNFSVWQMEDTVS